MLRINYLVNKQAYYEELDKLLDRYIKLGRKYFN